MATVRTFRTGEADGALLAALRRLLDDAFDGSFSDDDWDHTLGGWHAVAEVDGTVAAHAAVVPRTIEFGDVALRVGYVEGVATAAARRRTGLGSLVMRAAASIIDRDFAVGVLVTGEHGFYERLGWERWRGPAYVRRDGELIRTPDEDDAIMVLRVSRTPPLTVTDRIVCEARRGDDW